MIRTTMTALTALLLIGAAGCSHVPGALDRNNAPRGKGWEPLFNGKDFTGWHPRSTDRAMSWKMVDGVAVNESTHEKHGVDIITDRGFDDFEIYYEYKVAPHSNSGLYLRGRYEIQILDNAPDVEPQGLNGAFYSKAAPLVNVSKPAGQWQSVYARIVGRTACVVLNGQTIHCNYVIPGPTGGELDNAEDKPGPIMIQGDHGSLEVRNLWIRPLAKGTAAECGCAKPCPGGKECCHAKAKCPLR